MSNNNTNQTQLQRSQKKNTKKKLRKEQKKAIKTQVKEYFPLTQQSSSKASSPPVVTPAQSNVGSSQNTQLLTPALILKRMVRFSDPLKLEQQPQQESQKKR